ncbi:hypothetical protein ACFWDZ_33410, partial [Micromonospora aurantiaca]|uniref:hypothetical protein n=1 Tax=Micromonospora aurantiaca (nom. illeg.) TaxID=47850 RepID=UPI00365EAEF4
MNSPEPQWFLRVNPLRRSRLADPGQRRLLGELVRAEAELADAAEPCSQVLYERIGTAASDAERRELIALRRAIHNGRAPRKESDSPAARTPAVARWLAAHQ